MPELIVCQECEALNEERASECSGCGIVLKWSSRHKYSEAHKALGFVRQALTILCLICAMVSFGIAVQMEHGILRLFVALPGFAASAIFWSLLSWTPLTKTLVLITLTYVIGDILFEIYSGKELDTQGLVGLLTLAVGFIAVFRKSP